MNPEQLRTRRRRLRRAAAIRRAEHRAEHRRGKRTCDTSSKVRFPSFEAAVAAALRLSQRLGRPIRAYPCACGGWHLTRVKRWTRKDTA